MPTAKSDQEKLSHGLTLTMLNHTQRKLAMGREHLDFYRRKGLGMETADSNQGHDDMMVLGDLTVNHAPSQAAPSQPAAPQPSKTGNLAKAAIGAALLATGAGAGLGFPLILDALRTTITERVVEPGGTNTIERDYRIGEVEVIGESE